MKHAFTLIELLVVISIIAILAAILFPAFAQAKVAAKKTSTLANIKQSGTAIIMYEGDNDDNFPSAYSIDDGGGCYGMGAGQIAYQFGWVTTIPAGADLSICAAPDSQEWMNSTQPYRKSYAVTTNVGAPAKEIYSPDYLAIFNATPESGSFTMNGLLSTYSASEVAAPSRVPLLWPGMFNAISHAGVIANPVLFCDGNPGAACRFNPNGPPMAGGTEGVGDRADGIVSDVWGDDADTLWINGRGMTMTYADSSAKYVLVDPSGAESSGSYKHPYCHFMANGHPDFSLPPVRCSTGGPRYISLFRPDLDAETWPINDLETNACRS